MLETRDQKIGTFLTRMTQFFYNPLNEKHPKKKFIEAYKMSTPRKKYSIQVYCQALLMNIKNSWSLFAMRQKKNTIKMKNKKAKKLTEETFTINILQFNIVTDARSVYRFFISFLRMVWYGYIEEVFFILINLSKQCF